MNYKKLNCQVKSLGVQEIDVYDIEVDANHNFFANDILVHNSIFFDLDQIVKRHYKGKTDAEITSALDKLMETVVAKYVNEATDAIAEIQNYHKKTIHFKREKICSSGFFLAPKKYAIKVYDNEGVRYAEPDYAITGIEVVRSSTPEIARDALKQCIIHVIDRDLDSLRKVAEETKVKFMSSPVEDIAFPRGANNLIEYSSEETIYKKGCPIAVRGCLLHNYYLDKLKLGHLYQPIEEGSKIKFVYLKEPNHFKENIIAFDDVLPEEFKLEQYIDRELQYEKVFVAPLTGILKLYNWELEESFSLESL